MWCQFIPKQLIMECCFTLQEQVAAAVALAMEQQIQKLLVETQLDITELDNLLQPIIDTCTKDAISVGQHCRHLNSCLFRCAVIYPLSGREDLDVQQR